MHTFSTQPGAESKCYNSWQNHGDLIPSHYRRRYWGKWTTHWRVPHTQTHSDEIIGGLNSLREVQILWKFLDGFWGVEFFFPPSSHAHSWCGEATMGQSWIKAAKTQGYFIHHKGGWLCLPITKLLFAGLATHDCLTYQPLSYGVATNRQHQM